MAIDMITYEFLKRYVEGANMGENARPRGIWKQEPDDEKGPYKEGDYVTHNNVIYIWCNANNSSTNNPQPGTDNTYWQRIAGINPEEIFSPDENNNLITEGNTSYGQNNTAFGSNNIVGCKGYRIVAIQEKSSENKVLYNYTLELNENETIGYSISDEKNIVEVTIRLKDNYDYCGKIVEITEDTITLEIYSTSKIPSTLYLDENQVPYNIGDYNSLRVPSKPEVGNIIVCNNNFTSGYGNKAIGNYSYSEGASNVSAGKYSHTEGYRNIAAYGAHAEGNSNKALGQQAHVEGNETTASGANSHAEGRLTQASGANSHAEGNGTIADADKSHAEGNGSKAHTQGSHAEGYGTETSSENWSDRGQHVEGRYNVPTSGMAHIVGGGTGDTDRKNIYTLDWNGNAQFTGTVTANGKKLASLDDIPTSLKFTTEYEQLPASGKENLIYLIPNEDSYEEWIWVNSKWELIGSTKIDLTEYLLKTDAVGKKTASNGELFNTAKEASGANSHAENYNTSAIGANSHAEGVNTVAEGQKSHAEGEATKTYVQNSHAEGHGTETSSADWGWADRGQHVQGRFNTPISGMAHIVGNGTSNDNRSNAHTLDWKGNAWFAGDVTCTYNNKEYKMSDIIQALIESGILS